MEFALSDDQRLFQDSITGYLATEVPLDTVRAYAGGDAAVSAKASHGLLELGTPSILVPEAHGGLGLGLLDAALVQEALGYAVAPADFLAGSAMAVSALTFGAGAEQQAEWLPGIAMGEVRFGVAVNEAVSVREGAGVQATGETLSGRSLFAMETANATHILVSDQDRNLFVVEAGASGLSRNALTTIDATRDFAELVFDNTPAIKLNGGDAIDRVIQTGRLLLAADTLGAGQAMLDKAVAYAKERQQFNRVIGSFQAVKHLCAEMAAQLEPARALIWHAAHARDVDLDEADMMICLAKANLAEVGTFVARTSTEVHGGMGFTDLVGLHYWFKRIGVNRQLLGSPEAVRHDAARLQGWVN